MSVQVQQGELDYATEREREMQRRVLRATEFALNAQVPGQESEEDDGGGSDNGGGDNGSGDGIGGQDGGGGPRAGDGSGCGSGGGQQRGEGHGGCGGGRLLINWPSLWIVLVGEK